MKKNLNVGMIDGLSDLIETKNKERKKVKPMKMQKTDSSKAVKGNVNKKNARDEFLTNKIEKSIDDWIGTGISLGNIKELNQGAEVCGTSAKELSAEICNKILNGINDFMFGFMLESIASPSTESFGYSENDLNKTVGNHLPLMIASINKNIQAHLGNWLNEILTDSIMKDYQVNVVDSLTDKMIILAMETYEIQRYEIIKTITERIDSSSRNDMQRDIGFCAGCKHNMCGNCMKFVNSDICKNDLEKFILLKHLSEKSTNIHKSCPKCQYKVLSRKAA